MPKLVRKATFMIDSLILKRGGARYSLCERKRSRSCWATQKNLRTCWKKFTLVIYLTLSFFFFFFSSSCSPFFLHFFSLLLFSFRFGGDQDGADVSWFTVFNCFDSEQRLLLVTYSWQKRTKLVPLENGRPWFDCGHDRVAIAHMYQLSSSR